jgi:glycosyltransferase involved in cell wall biosynthesis
MLRYDILILITAYPSGAIIFMNRIAYLYYFPLITGPPADTVHTMKMCQAFQQEGYDITLYVPETKQPFTMDELWQHYGVHTTFEIRFMKRRSGLRQYDASVLSVLEAYRQPGTIAYARNHFSGMLAAYLGMPTLFDVHGAPPPRMGQVYLRFLFQSKNFRRLVAITQPLKNLYLKHYNGVLSKEQVHVDPNGADLTQFADLPAQDILRQRLELPSECLIALYAGNLYRGRGVDVILETARALPDVLFLLVGGTEQQIVDWKERISQPANLIFTGFVPNQRLPMYLRAADILLMPYQRKVYVHGQAETSSWMSPMKMFDYLASKRVIISGDVPVLHEVLNKKNAIFCPPADVSAWVEAISHIRDNPRFAAQLAEQAWQDAQYFTWRKRVQRVMDFN